MQTDIRVRRPGRAACEQRRERGQRRQRGARDGGNGHPAGCPEQAPGFFYVESMHVPPLTRLAAMQARPRLAGPRPEKPSLRRLGKG